ncbi:MAG: hypothetical protein LBT30_04955 [Clostridiales bacterium]|jgi:amino acid permease|nr:hypothetical protein [Clostridiales bacterium]
MSRESLILNCDVLQQQQTVHDYESFGWELLNVSDNRISLSRETQNQIYPELLKHQIQYEEIKKKIKGENNYFETIKAPTKPIYKAIYFIILFIISIIFFIIYFNSQNKNTLILGIISIIIIIIYILYITNKKKIYNLENEKYQKTCEEHNITINKLNYEKNKICETSRATFFSKQ